MSALFVPRSIWRQPAEPPPTATVRSGHRAILPVAHIWDRTVYGRQQDFEDSPDGWPQEPTYG